MAREYEKEIAELKTRVAENLRYLVAVSGKSHLQISREAGIDQSYVSRLIDVSSAPNREYGLDSLLRMSRVLGVPIRLILEEDLRAESSKLIKVLSAKKNSSSNS